MTHRPVDPSGVDYQLQRRDHAGLPDQVRQACRVGGALRHFRLADGIARIITKGHSPGRNSNVPADSLQRIRWAFPRHHAVLLANRRRFDIAMFEL